MDQEKLTNYLITVTNDAAANMEPAKAGCKHIVVPQIRVIGGARIESLSMLVDQAIMKAKRIVVPIFLTEGLLLLLLLLLL
jgi:predicted neutral ceramidase superfamily lipid hydrolase